MAAKIPARGMIWAVLASNGVSVLLFCLRLLATGKPDYWFMFWNLLLAWAPFGAALVLLKELRNKSWRQPTPVFLTIIWLLFLPNSFYMISDLVHLQSTGDISVLFDIVMFMSFIWNGLLAGYASLVIVHRELLKRLDAINAHALVTATILLNSFAIYLGRELRWNSWDILLSPGGLLFDISERVVNPLGHPLAFVTTATFFLLIGSIYLVIWQFAGLLPKTKA